MIKITDRNIAFRVDDELFRRIKLRALQKGVTLKDYFLGLAEKDLLEADLDKAVSCSPEELIQKADEVIRLMNEIKEAQK